MRDALLASAPEAILAGPTRLVLQIVGGAVRNAADAFAEALGSGATLDEAARSDLVRGVGALAAWVRVHVECEAIQSFSFDPEYDDRAW